MKQKSNNNKHNVQRYEEEPGPLSYIIPLVLCYTLNFHYESNFLSNTSNC